MPTVAFETSNGEIWCSTVSSRIVVKFQVSRTITSNNKKKKKKEEERRGVGYM